WKNLLAVHFSFLVDYGPCDTNRGAWWAEHAPRFLQPMRYSGRNVAPVRIAFAAKKSESAALIVNAGNDRVQIAAAFFVENYAGAGDVDHVSHQPPRRSRPRCSSEVATNAACASRCRSCAGRLPPQLRDEY